MKETLVQYKDKGIQFWKRQSGIKKGVIIGSAAMFILAIALVVMLSKPDYVPLYSNLSPQETGQIKETLDSKGVSSQVSDNGTTILVPKSDVDALKVELAAEGIPESGHIDYSFFGENSGWGMTDKEVDILKQEAMQTELSRLIESVNGVRAANVMISLPEDTVWVADEEQEATASIVLNLEPGYRIQPEQVQSLYHLVAKSVPNLPVENIVIMDEMFNYFEPVEDDPFHSSLSAYEQQQEVKRDIEENLQQRIQRMLGMMIGRDKVVVSVTTDVDFTKENRVEELVEPVDEENLEGLQVSVEKIRETYSGDAEPPGGVGGTGPDDIPGYEEDADREDGDYERVEERVNNAVNRIRKEVVQSPYEIRDIGIQVMLEPPDPENPGSLPQGRIDDIENILATVIRTSMPEDGGQPITNQDIQDKISISVQPFNGRVEAEPQPGPILPYWYYIIAGVLLLAIILLAVLLLRKRKVTDEAPEVTTQEEDDTDSRDIEEETEDTNRLRQLEQMARERPEEFAKLLRSWLSE